jgi:hypothetical protein
MSDVPRRGYWSNPANPLMHGGLWFKELISCRISLSKPISCDWMRGFTRLNDSSVRVRHLPGGKAVVVKFDCGLVVVGWRRLGVARSQTVPSSRRSARRLHNLL